MSRRFIPSGVPKGVNLSATVDRLGVWHKNESVIPPADRHDCSKHLPDERERVRLNAHGERVRQWQSAVTREFGVGDNEFDDYAAEVYDGETL